MRLENLALTSEEPLHSHKACLVGFATKGPIGTPTMVTSPQQLYHFYGNAAQDLPMVLVAEQILALNSPVLMLRVADEDAKTASSQVPCSSHQILQAKNAGPYKLTKNNFFRWACNGVISPKILVALKGETTAKELADQFNDQANRHDGIFFYEENDLLSVRCNGQLEILGVQDSIYGVLGIESLVHPAELISDEVGEVELADAHNLLVVVGGTGNLTVDNITQTVGFKSIAGRRCSLIEVANCINSQLSKNLPGGFEALVRDGCLVLRTLHGGSNTSLKIKAASTARTPLGFKQLTASGLSLEVPDSPDVNSCFTIQTESPGTAGNAVRVQVELNHDDTFNLRVFHDSGLVESWNNLSKNTKDKFYVESFVNLVSNWIKITDNLETTRPPRAGSYHLGKSNPGTNGVPASEGRRRDLLTGDIGLSTLLSTDYDIDLIALPGETSVEAMNGLIQFCDKRGDCLAIMDTPRDMPYVEALRWKRRLNESSTAAAYWPWVKVWDSRNRSEVVIPPCGSIIAALTRCDQVSCAWNSPSGMTRGVVPGVLDLMHRPRFTDRGGPRVEPELNAILLKDGVFFIQSEATLDGGKISLKRLVILLKKMVRKGIDNLLRDCDVADGYFTESFIQTCDQIMKQVKLRQGIQHYHIKAGDELNTPEVRANGGFRAQIGVQPSNTSVWVSFDFSLTTGVANQSFVSKNRRS